MAASTSIVEGERNKGRKTFRKFSPYLFLAPHLIFFLVFFLLPSLFGIFISFTDWNLFGTPSWVGLDNYQTILMNEESTFHTQFYNGLFNTFKFVLFSVPFCIIVPLLLAAALNAKPKLHKFFQSVFYLPTLLAISAVTLIWSIMFSSTQGPINNMLNLDILWTASQPYAWVVIVVVTIWWTIGGNMIIYQAALNGISKDYYEAAEIDGATAVQKFFKITLPSIRGQLLYTIVMTTIAQFNIYGQPLMLTGGGPTNSTRVLLMYIQSNAFGSGQSIAGIASAMAVMLGLCIMIVSAIQFVILTRDDRK